MGVLIKRKGGEAHTTLLCSTLLERASPPVFDTSVFRPDHINAKKQVNYV